MKKALPVIVLLLAAGAGAAYWFLVMNKSRKAESVTIAVIDSGLDPSKFPSEPERRLKLAVNAAETAGNGADDDRNGKSDDLSGWNFFDSSADTRDEDGHGTEVALRIFAECPECRILPLKVTKSGAGVRPEDIVNALMYAMEQGADVVNFSFGVNEGSDELKAVVQKAAREGVILVAAAGVGVPNPFKAVPLSEMYPQAYPEMIVVGSAREVGNADLVINHGPEMDLVQVQKPDPDNKTRRGSSFAAGTVSGAIGRHLFSNAGLRAPDARAALREATFQPDVFDLDRFGFGIFDGRLLSDTDPDETDFRVYGEGEEHRMVDFSSSENIRGLDAAVRCAGREGEPLPKEKISVEIYSKGRARLGVQAPAGQACRAAVKLKLEGLEEDLEVSL